MWLDYSHREVESFHPLAKEILKSALSRLNLSDKYKVEHHRSVGSLEMDLVISNRESSKILCVVEIKRTIEAVYSTRYQLQAMSYVQQLRSDEKEKDYYILTNLEAVALFRYSPSRPNVIDQLLAPGIETVCRFSSVSREVFVDRLSAYFATLISGIINDNINYYSSFRHFVEELTEDDDCVLSDRKTWHSKFAALAYEYIRGSLFSAGRNNLTDIRRLNSDISRICGEALRVNFKDIYGLDASAYSDLPSLPPDTLNELYSLGLQYHDADAISDILFNLIARTSPYPGAVPTDLELAKALAVVVSSFCPSIEPDKLIIDPAAGCGNLLAVMPEVYPDIKPSQLMANDINEYLLQILSLRLGLKFPKKISSADSPAITSHDIAQIPDNFFDNAGLIVLNPPYLSHTANASNDYKTGILNRIHLISGQNATTHSLKSPLESVFVELVSMLAPKGATIACIIPLSHLYGLGVSEKLFREMLLERFGLCCIFRYPQQNIFRSVVQNTCIIVGKIGHKPQEIHYVGSIETIDNIDFNTLRHALTDPDFQARNGIERTVFSRDVLVQTSSTGWKILDSIASTASNYLSAQLLETGRYILMCDSEELKDNYRGRIGNMGASDLLFPKPDGDFYKSVKEIIEPHLKTGLRTVQRLKRPYLSDTDTPFLDCSDMQSFDLTIVASEYKASHERAQRRQIRFSKSVEDYINILKHDAPLSVPAGSVLLARDCRRTGRAYLAKTTIYPSTNVWVFEIHDARKGRFYHSWFCSIFYQLNCELTSKNHAGTRKMDAAEFANTFVPDYEAFSDLEVDEIIACNIDTFTTLNSPKIRECDRIWAKIISPSYWEQLLDETARYLSLLATDRES